MNDNALLLREAALRRTNYWEDKGLLEGVNDEFERGNLVMMLENQKAWLNEAATTSADVAPFTKFAFPLVRRVYPELLANKLVSVQPIPMPSAMVFYLDFRYRSQLDPVMRGDRMDYQGYTEDGSTVAPGANIRKALNYTRGWVRGAVVGEGDGTETEFQLPSPYNTPYLQTTFTSIQDNGNLAVYVNSSLVPPADYEVDFQTGAIVFDTAPASSGVITADYDLKFEGDDSRIPEIGMDMHSTQVQAESRKIKYRWTMEAQQDFRAYHGLSVESELMNQAAGEIMREIDRQIIGNILDATSENVNWVSAQPDPTVEFGYPSRRDWDETLVHAILEAENRIYKKRLQKPNWLVTSPDVAVRLEKLNSFSYAGTSGDRTGTVQKASNLYGTLNGRFNVYVDPLFDSDKILLGYKGTSPFDAGYVFAPYVPLMATNVFTDPDDFTPRRGLMRRDAHVLLSDDMYATVTVQ